MTALGFGAMGISAFYGMLSKFHSLMQSIMTYRSPGDIESDEDRFKVLDTIYEEGCRFWDTADIYGDSEELLGKWYDSQAVFRSA